MGACIYILRPDLKAEKNDIFGYTHFIHLNWRRNKPYHKMMKEIENLYSDYVVMSEGRKVIPCTEAFFQRGFKLRSYGSDSIIKYALTQKQMDAIFQRYIRWDRDGLEVYRNCQREMKDGLIFMLAW